MKWMLSLVVAHAMSSCVPPASTKGQACVCPKGQVLQSDGRSCREIDACNWNPDLCKDQLCQSIASAVTCIPFSEHCMFNWAWMRDNDSMEWLSHMETWLSQITANPVYRRMVIQLHSFSTTCPSAIVQWNATCAKYQLHHRLYWQIYHAESRTKDMISPRSEVDTFGAANMVALRDACDLDMNPLWESMDYSHAQLMAEYFAILPLSMAVNCFYSPIVKNPGMGFGSWKTFKLPRPCDSMKHVHWQDLPARHLLFWNQDLQGDMKSQTNRYHSGDPSLWQILEDFFLEIFQLQLPVIAGPNPCCSHFYADPVSLVQLAKLQTIAFVFFDQRYPQTCPFATEPVNQHLRCAA